MHVCTSSACYATGTKDVLVPTNTPNNRAHGEVPVQVHYMPAATMGILLQVIGGREGGRRGSMFCMSHSNGVLTRLLCACEGCGG